MQEFQEECWNLCQHYKLLFQKERNAKQFAKALWYIANEDITLARYYVFELLAEYCCHMNVEEILQSVRNKGVGWNHPQFSVYREREAEADTFLTHPPEVEEGVIECRRCHSKKTFSFSKQTRRADESATVFVRCSQCHLTFKF